MDVYLPQPIDNKRTYPVLYVMDSQHYMYNAVGYQRSLVADMSGVAISPEYIVVGINTTKLVEKEERYQNLIDTAPELNNLLRNRIIPFVDANYPTNHNRVYFGWQYAANFGLGLFNESPDLFDAYLLSSSPFFGKRLLSQTEHVLVNRKNLSTRFYLSLGQSENWAVPGYQALIKMFEKDQNNSIKWQYRQHDRFSVRYDHFTTPLEALTDGLAWYFSDFPDLNFQSLEDLEAFGGIDAVKAYYQTRAKRYQLSQEVGVLAKYSLFRATMNADNYRLFQEFEQELGDAKLSESYSEYGHFFQKHGDLERAVDTFLLAIKDFPEEIDYRASLGKIYQKQGDNVRALENFQKATELAQQKGQDDSPYLLLIQQLQTTP